MRVILVKLWLRKYGFFSETRDKSADVIVPMWCLISIEKDDGLTLRFCFHIKVAIHNPRLHHVFCNSTTIWDYRYFSISTHALIPNVLDEMKQISCYFEV